MKKVIVIDIDDVLMDLSPLRKQVMEYFGISSPTDYLFSNWPEEAKTAIFWAFNQTEKMALGTPIPGALNALKILSDQHQVTLGTARNIELHQFTVNQICGHFPLVIRPYQIHSTGGSKEKLYKKLNANIIIDDRFENIMTALNCPTVEKCYLVSNDKTTWNHQFRRIAESSNLIEIVNEISDIKEINV